MLIGSSTTRASRPPTSRRYGALVTGGAIVPPALVQRAEAAFGAPLSTVFAQTEASPVITQTAPGRRAGPPRDDARAPAAADRGEDRRPRRPAPPLEPDVVGELCTRGYHVMTRLLRRPARRRRRRSTRTAGCTRATSPRWTTRGYCRIGGRLKDMIIRGGENIYPREIEQVLFEHEDVADVAVVGVPDADWGEQVAAFIRPRRGPHARPGRAVRVLPRAARAATRRRATGRSSTRSR